jgi:hypothetical protein
VRYRGAMDVLPAREPTAGSTGLGDAGSRLVVDKI